MPIPKTIHFFWFGRSRHPAIVRKCVESWRRVLPEYEIICWNEDNFDFTQNLFARQAYEKKRYAFVADYARLHVLYHHGGIYMDADTEVLKPLDRFLHHPAFIGVVANYLQTALIGAQKHNPWIKDLLDYYDAKTFVNPDASLNIEMNNSIVNRITEKKYGLRRDNTYQELAGAVAVYPDEFFGSDNPATGKFTITENTHVLHHFMSSWQDRDNFFLRKLMEAKTRLRWMIGRGLYKKLSIVYRWFVPIK